MSKYKIICKETDYFCINYIDMKCVRNFVFASLCVIFFFELAQLNIVIRSTVPILFALIIQALTWICGRT